MEKNKQDLLQEQANFRMEKNNMIQGAKGHVFHACMKKHDFGTRKNMRK